MASERKRYCTRQQQEILACMKRHTGEFKTVEQVTEELHLQKSAVGRTTTYRALRRLVHEGVICKVPSIENEAARYGYIPGDAGAKLVCTHCHEVSLLDCDGLETFVHHVEEGHHFSVDPTQTVLYGVCNTCEHQQDP